MNSNNYGKDKREELSWIQLFEMFPDDEAAEKWFIQQRWPDGIRCAYCDCDNVQLDTTHPRMPFRCRPCKRFFSPKSNTIMQNSKLGYQAWAIAIHQMIENPKGISSVQLGRRLGITQPRAWHLLHKIREAYNDQMDAEPFDGEVEVDEMFVGGLEKNKHAKNKLHAGPFAGKTPVVGVLDRESNQVKATVVDSTDRETLQQFVLDNTTEAAIVYTDSAREYRGMPRKHDWVVHSRGEYVRGRTSTNGIESFWAPFKRGFKGTYHMMSRKHLQRYVNEFVGRHNHRSEDIIDQMAGIVEGMVGKQLRYQDLIAE